MAGIQTQSSCLPVQGSSVPTQLRNLFKARGRVLDVSPTCRTPELLRGGRSHSRPSWSLKSAVAYSPPAGLGSEQVSTVARERRKEQPGRSQKATEDGREPRVGDAQDSQERGLGGDLK